MLVHFLPGKILCVLLTLTLLALPAAVFGYMSQEHMEERAGEVYQEARDYELQGRASNALRRYKGLLKAFPDTSYAPRAQFQIARLYHSNKEYVSAFRAYEKVINNYPESDLFNETVAGEFAVAEEVFRRSVRKKRNPDLAPNLELPDTITLRDMFRVIMTQATQGEYAAQSLYYMAVTYQIEDDPDTAREVFERFNDEYPRSVLSDDAAFQIAYIEYQKGTSLGIDRGRLRQAKFYFEDFLIRFSGSDKVPEAKYLLSRIDGYNLGYYRRAAEYYQRQGHESAANIYRGEAAKIVAKHGSEEAMELPDGVPGPPVRKAQPLPEPGSVEAEVDSAVRPGQDPRRVNE